MLGIWQQVGHDAPDAAATIVLTIGNSHAAVIADSLASYHVVL